MPVQSSRIERISRYREQTLDRAAVVAALALARVEEYELGALTERQDVQLAELLHDFAFRLRKLIELTRREELRSHKVANSQSVGCSRVGGTSPLFDMRLMSIGEICGRIIHSDTFEICRAQMPGKGGSITPGRAAWAFSVASDRDKSGESTLVFVEFFLQEFLAFDAQLAADLRVRSRDPAT